MQLIGIHTNLFQFFKGHWQLDRVISDTISEQVMARATGKAVFTPANGQGNALLFREEGKLAITGSETTHSFFRNYGFRFDGPAMDVYFSDEVTGNINLYQSYALDKRTGILHAMDAHLCGNDDYRGEYRIFSEHLFSNTTVVKGNRKNYTTQTTFVRCAALS